MPRINLLPWREQQRTERKKAFAVGMFAAMLGAVAVAGVGWFFINQLINAQQDRNKLLKDEITVLDKKNEEIANLEAQKKQFLDRMEIIEKLQQSRPEIVHVLDSISRIVPDGVYLTSVRQSGRSLKIQGVTQSSTRVSTFMRNIDESGWLRNAALEKIEAARGGGQSSSFILNVQLRDATAADK
jgi:type IV pilus assembly protein PilN